MDNPRLRLNIEFESVKFYVIVVFSSGVDRLLAKQ